ncbi:MAG: hypothetical protein QM758_04530 [Armatimonas sp.]
MTWEEPGPPPPITARDIARLFKRRWPLMLVTLIAVPAATHYLTRRMTPVYEAKARLLIESPLPASIPPGIASFLGGVASSPLDVEVEKMKSRAFMAEVGKAAKATDPPEALMGKITFAVKTPTPIVEISARASTGPDAAALANSVISIYKQSVNRETDSKSNIAAVKLHAATRKLEAEKQAATRAVEDFARRMGISDPAVIFNIRAAKTAQVRSDLEEARKQAGILDTGIAEAKRQMETLSKQREIVTNYPMVKNPLIDSIPTDINNKLAERKLALEDFQPDSPEVQRIDSEIKALQEKLDRAQKEAYSVGSKGMSLNPDYQTARTRWWSLQQEQQTNTRRIRENQAQLGTLQVEQRNLTQLRTRYEQLKRTEARANALYEEARVGEIKSQVANLTRLPNIKVLDAARDPGLPISPNPKLNLALALGLGILLSLGMGLLAEFLSPPPREPRPEAAPEPLPGLPSVAGVPLLGVAPIAALPAHTTQAPKLALGGAATEDALREIGYGLAHRVPGAPAPVALLVGTRSDDSCAALIAYLSALLLRDGLRITLVDADRANPRLHRVFGKPDAPGLADALSGRRVTELLHRTEDGGFRFLAAGDPDDETPLTEDALRKTLEELATTEKTDLVLVCGPSVWNARAVASLERAAGGLVLVASPETSAEDSVARARRLLTNGYTPNISGVITHERPALPSIDKTQ